MLTSHLWIVMNGKYSCISYFSFDDDDDVTDRPYYLKYVFIITTYIKLDLKLTGIFKKTPKQCKHPIIPLNISGMNSLK